MIPQEASKHIVIVAGEASGDHHGAALIQQLKLLNKNYVFSGIGGVQLQQAGMLLLSNLAQHGVTGFIEVLRYARVIKAAYRKLQQHLIKTRPDLLILIDYPGFNLRIAKFAKQKLGIKILYYISPQIWAWKAKRIQTIAENVDHMAVILPFEKIYYERANVPVSFVGHPLVERITNIKVKHPLKTDYNIPENKKIIALLPGSRVNEVEKHMPIFYEYARKMSEKHADLHFVIPIAETLENTRLTKHWPEHTDISYSFIKGQALETAYCSDMIIVASGTASLECALLNKPMCIIYKVSLLTYVLATKFIRVKYLGLCNLLLNQMAVPELIQYDFNPKELVRLSTQLLNDHAYAQNMNDKLTQMEHQLSSAQIDLSLCDLVQKMLI